MNTPSDDQRFLELLQRWQSGDFNRQDERTLRSLTESDDFRREAMEGFMALPETDHSTHLTALREQLRMAAPPRSRVVSIPQMMAIAAALLVLVAAIWFFPRTAKEQSTPIAQNSQPSSPSPTAAPSLPEADSQASDAIAAQTAPQLQPTERPSAIQSPERQGDYAYQVPAGKDQAAASSAVEESAAPPPVTEAAPVATRPAATDDELSGRPPSSPATLSKARTTAKPTPAKTTAFPVDTTGVAWHDTEKKSDLTKVKQEVLDDRLGLAQSEPAEGWSVFNEYLRQNARLPLEARNRNASGNVRLQFTVNANGDPQNFIVLRSLGQSCDDEAKRLVQNWTWIRGQNPLVIVEVKFVR